MQGQNVRYEARVNTPRASTFSLDEKHFHQGCLKHLTALQLVAMMDLSVAFVEKKD